MHLSCLTLVQKAAARLLIGSRRRDDVTLFLASLHLLLLCLRVDFKVGLFVLKALNGLTLSYITNRLRLYATSSSSDHLTWAFQLPRAQNLTLKVTTQEGTNRLYQSDYQTYD